MVAKAFDQIQSTGKVCLFKSDHPDYRDGEQMRDFLYIHDAIEMTLFLAENPKAGGLYNIGSGKAHTWNQLVNAIFYALDKKPVIEYIPLPEHLKKQYQYYTCSDNQRLLSLGYDRPVWTLESAVSDYVKNHLLTGHVLGY
jgi:ADP-L-glycero-D-manno-heptose 6-epimerase